MLIFVGLQVSIYQLVWADSYFLSRSKLLIVNKLANQ